MAFSAMSGIVFENSPADISVTAEAASYKKDMLPYCYYKLDDAEKKAYLKVRTAFINHEDSLKIEIPTKTMDMFSNILRDADVLTNFNFPFENGCLEYYYYEDTGLTESVEFDYNYSEDVYKNILKKADKAADKVISKFTDKTSTYSKIKYIHDYIIKKTDYDTEASTGNSIYGALVKGKAKCDGYAHAFQYICEKAGIRAVTVFGETVDAGKDVYHAWNKVYYKKKWYNIDVTWDDPDNGLKDNLSYRYFMVSDKQIGDTHTQIDGGYYVPKASARGMDYYSKNGLKASSVSEAREILANAITDAAKKGKSVVTISFSDEEVYKDAIKYLDDDYGAFDVIDIAEERAHINIINEGYFSLDNDQVLYTYTIIFYYPKTSISDYFELSAVDKESEEFLIDLGLKNE